MARRGVADKSRRSNGHGSQLDEDDSRQEVDSELPKAVQGVHTGTYEQVHGLDWMYKLAGLYFDITCETSQASSSCFIRV